MSPLHPKTSAKGSSTKHTWTSEDRIILAVLTKFYELSKNDITSIFNRVIEDRLTSENMPNGLAVATIQAQVNDIKRTSRGKEFQEIQSMSLAEARQKFHLEKDRIESAAQSLMIALKLRVHAPRQQIPSPLKRGPEACRDEWSSNSDSDEPCLRESPGGSANRSASKRRRRTCGKPKIHTSTSNRARQVRTRRESTVGTVFTSTSLSSVTTDSCSCGSWVTGSDSEDEENLVLDKNDFAATASRMNPRLRLHFNKKGKLAPTRPRLLFRAFDPTHMLRARKFLTGHSEIPPPPDYDSDEFHNIVSKHLHEDKSFASPFISITENPARALEIITKAKHPLSLAIVDYNELEADMEQRFGSAALWLVPVICRDHGLDRLTRIHDDRAAPPKPENARHYNGVGEFLTWGSIECPTVAILHAREAVRMYNCLKSVTGVGHETGRAIALSLNSVSNIYREAVGYKLLRAFRVPGYLRGCRGFDYEEFARGIYGEASMVELSPAPSISTRATPDEDDWVEVGKSDFDTSASKNSTEFLKSLENAKKNKIVVEIPTKSFQESISQKSPLSPATQYAQDSEDELQQLVDSQLSEMGSPFGITTAPISDCSGPARNKSEISLLKTSGVDSETHSYPNDGSDEKAVVKKLVTEETITKAEGKTAKFEMVDGCPSQKWIKRPSPTRDLDLFAWELLTNAMIPTPTPPLQCGLLSAESSEQVDLTQAEPSSIPPVPTSSAPKLITRGEPESVGIPTEIDKEADTSPDQNRTPSIVRTLIEMASLSEQSERVRRRIGPPGLKQPPTTTIRPAPQSPQVTVDLTSEEDSNQHSRGPSGRKLRAPENSPEVQRSRTTTTAQGVKSSSSVRGKQSNIYRQLSKVTKPVRASVETSFTEDNEENDDELEIIGETKRGYRHHHVRTTKRTQTTTVLTVRSRSLSEGIAFS